MTDQTKLALRIALTAVASVAQACTLLLLARILGPATFGVFGFVLATGYIMGGLAGLGLSTLALRSMSTPSWRQDASAILMTRAATTTLVVVILFSASVAINAKLVPYIVAAVTFVAAELMSEVCHAVISGRHRQVASAIILVGQRLASFAVFLVFVLGLSDPLAGVAVGAMLNLALPIILLLKIHARPARVRDLLHRGRGYWFATVAASVSQGDVVVAGAIGGSVPGGLVSAGSRLISPLNIVTTAVLNVFVPSMSRTMDRAEQLAIFRTARRVCLSWAVLLIAASPLLVWLLIGILGPDYSAGAGYYLAMVVGAGVSAISQSYQARLYVLDSARWVGVSVLAGSLFGLAAIGLGLALFGVPGLAVGPIVTQLSILAMLAGALRHFDDIPHMKDGQ